MAIKVTLEGVDRLNKTLKTLQEVFLQQGRPEVIVGYSANYAIYVHENLTARHPGGGQAKYLEKPLREKHKIIAKIVTDNFRKSRSLAQSLVLGGMYLQGESQRLVPVDTGYLRASAFTKLDKAK